VGAASLELVRRVGPSALRKIGDHRIMRRGAIGASAGRRGLWAALRMSGQVARLHLVPVGHAGPMTTTRRGCPNLVARP